jgi:hypothetical protein
VTYGFHPEEPLAEEVGKALVGYRPDRVEAVRFRPSYMPENVHHLPDNEPFRITLAGTKELRKFVRENYKSQFILEMHETPIEIDETKSIRSEPQFALLYPSFNVKLEKEFRAFARGCGEPIDITGGIPSAFPGYHSATIDYYSNIKTKNGLKSLSKEQGTEFAKDLIDYLLVHYLP